MIKEIKQSIDTIIKNKNTMGTKKDRLGGKNKIIRIDKNRK